MSQKRKAQRARHEAQQEKQAKGIINWIFGVLVVLAIVFLVMQIINA